MAMIFGETDPSGRASCCKCQNRIHKGSKRLVIEYQDGRMQKSDKYCKKHSLKLLQELIKELNNKDKK